MKVIIPLAGLSTLWSLFLAFQKKKLFPKVQLGVIVDFISSNMSVSEGLSLFLNNHAMGPNQLKLI